LQIIFEKVSTLPINPL